MFTHDQYTEGVGITYVCAHITIASTKQQHYNSTVIKGKTPSALWLVH